MKVYVVARGILLTLSAALGITVAPLLLLGQSLDEVTFPKELVLGVSAPPEPDGAAIFAELFKQNELRKAHLQAYSETRVYIVRNPNGMIHARKSVHMEYTAPGKKEFITTSEEGSYPVRKMALNRLIEAEVSAAAGKEHRDSSISPANYTFRLLGREQIGPYHCYVAQAVPTRNDKYLFAGKVWIDDRDFAIVKIAGHPAKKPSFWTNRIEFVRSYQKIGDFWLASREETYVDVKLYGKKVLTIEHHFEKVNGLGKIARKEGTPAPPDASQ